jgi:hypothetical protein
MYNIRIQHENSEKYYYFHIVEVFFIYKILLKILETYKNWILKNAIK